MTKTEVEVITSVQRRRRWSAAEKERLVAASLGVNGWLRWTRKVRQRGRRWLMDRTAGKEASRSNLLREAPAESAIDELQA